MLLLLLLFMLMGVRHGSFGYHHVHMLMEAVRTSETSVYSETARRYIPER
jgi:hypothetical protein